MVKKYKLTSESKEWYGVKLYRIEAVSDLGSVSKGEKGGFVEKEANLSQDGNAWVYGDAQVSGNARVFGDAQVYGNAWVYGNARVSGNARVYKKEKIIGGYFYHTKQKSEKVETMENDETYETLCRDPKYGDADEKPKDDLRGKVVEVKIGGDGGETYTATIETSTNDKGVCGRR